MATNKRFIKLIKSVELMYIPLVQKGIQQQLDYYANGYAKGETRNELPTQGINKALRGIYETAGMQNAKYAREQIKRSAKAFDNISDKLKWMINEYYKQNLLQQAVVPITDTTRRQIALVLQESNEKGWGIDKTVRALKNTDITKQRAKLIARTESMKAANAGAMLSAAEMDIAVNKMWISSQDVRTRRIPRDQYDHLHMNKRVVGFNESFIVPSTKTIDSMLFPGDPNGSAGNVCNCRCTVVFVPIKDALGNTVSLRSTLPAQGIANSFVQIAVAAASFTVTTEIINSLIEGLEMDIFL